MSVYHHDSCALNMQSPCDGWPELHHWVSYGMARGNKKIHRLLKDNPPELTTTLCKKHHDLLGRNKHMRKIIIRQKIQQFGFAWMEYVVNSLPWKVKHHRYTLKGLLA